MASAASILREMQLIRTAPIDEVLKAKLMAQAEASLRAAIDAQASLAAGVFNINFKTDRVAADSPDGRHEAAMTSKGK